MRKHQAIDLLHMYSTCTAQQWNEFLTDCLAKRDIETLTTVRYQLQAGMVDLAKKKLNSEKMIDWFLRLQTSIEKTIKKILRMKRPNPCDNPLQAVQFLEFKEMKTERDQELEAFLKKTSY